MDNKPSKPGAQKLKKMELLQSGVGALYQDRLLCDVQLEAEGKIFSAHRAILSAVSEYFRAMFSGGFKESAQVDKPIGLQGISAVGLEVILDSIYTTELKLTPENILVTIPVACMLQIQPLIEECEEFLISSISAEKYFIFEETAERYSFERAMESFSQYKTACFPEISKTLDFKKLNVEEVVSYLSSPDLFLHGQEMTASDAAIGWLEFKPEEREKHTLDVFQCKNLLQIPASDITEKVSKVNAIMKNSECEALVTEAIKYHKEIFKQPFYEGRIVNTRGVTDGVVAFPYWNDWDPETIFENVPDYKEILEDPGQNTIFWKYYFYGSQNQVNCLGSPIPENRLSVDFVISKIPE